MAAHLTMAGNNFTIVGLGELLWDLLPKGKELGGAPSNFAYIASILGDRGVVASRVGTDQHGRAAGRRLKRLGLPTNFVQLDAQHATGTGLVHFDGNGQPQYEFTEPVAWDFFEWTPEWQKLAGQADAICFGSLAQRSQLSRRTTRDFLSATRPAAIRIFDVNLRPPHYSAEILAESGEQADIIKVNDEELLKVVEILGAPASVREKGEASSAKWLLKACDVKLVCVTRGAKGSLLVSPSDTNEHPGFSVEVVDTVGAGDAFTAGLVHHYLRGAQLDVLNEAANRMGSWVAGKLGATPRPEISVLDQVRRVGR